MPHRGRDNAKMWVQEGVEMFFAPDAPQDGDEWGANFYRFVRELGWSPTYGSFHETARFGTLRFVNP